MRDVSGRTKWWPGAGTFSFCIPVRPGRKSTHDLSLGRGMLARAPDTKVLLRSIVEWRILV
jgi:hypothetical protein